MNRKNLAPAIRFPFCFQHCCCALQNRAAVSGLVSSGLTLVQKPPLVVFLLPCSLFAPSPCLTTPFEQTHLENVLVDFATLVPPHTKHLTIFMGHYLVSFIAPLQLHKRNSGTGAGKRVGKEKERRVNVVKPKMAACSSKGGERET